MKAHTLLAATLLLAGTAHAQERAAAGTTETQMTWSALKSLVEKAETNSTAAHSRIDQLVDCGKLNMLYGPGHAKANTKGCIAIDTAGAMAFVPATNRYYQHTGVKVKKGQKVTMKVTGKVSWARTGSGPSVNYHDASARIDATGQKYAKYNPICPLRYTISSAAVHADAYDYSGTSYCAKNDLTFTAPSTGDIYVGIPEGGSSTGDNDGGFTVSLTVE